MQINQAGQTSAIYAQQQKNTTLNSESSAGSEGVNNQVKISDAGKNAASSWQSIADKYDLNNISRNERVALATELSNNSLISSDQAMHMIAPLSMNEPGDTKVNFKNIVETSLSNAKAEGGNIKQVNLIENLLSTLNLLDDLAGNSNSTT